MAGTPWECACSDEHYVTNAGRGWCSDCREWCYPGDPEMLCIRGLLPHLEAEVRRLRPIAEAAEEYVRRGPRADGAWQRLFDAVQGPSSPS